MQAPIVHLNGTSQRELLEQISEVMRAIEVLFTAMQKAAPHSRDYYPFPDGAAAFRVAVEEHTARLRRVEFVKQDYEALGIAIVDQREKGV
jgi:hypothetical protein